MARFFDHRAHYETNGLILSGLWSQKLYPLSLFLALWLRLWWTDLPRKTSDNHLRALFNGSGRTPVWACLCMCTCLCACSITSKTHFWFILNTKGHSFDERISECLHANESRGSSATIRGSCFYSFNFYFCSWQRKHSKLWKCQKKRSFDKDRKKLNQTDMQSCCHR